MSRGESIVLILGHAPTGADLGEAKRNLALLHAKRLRAMAGSKPACIAYWERVAKKSTPRAPRPQSAWEQIVSYTKGLYLNEISTM